MHWRGWCSAVARPKGRAKRPLLPDTNLVALLFAGAYPPYRSGSPPTGTPGPATTTHPQRPRSSPYRGLFCVLAVEDCRAPPRPGWPVGCFSWWGADGMSPATDQWSLTPGRLLERPRFLPYARPSAKCETGPRDYRADLPADNAARSPVIPRRPRWLPNSLARTGIRLTLAVVLVRHVGKGRGDGPCPPRRVSLDGGTGSPPVRGIEGLNLLLEISGRLRLHQRGEARAAAA